MNDEKIQAIPPRFQNLTLEHPAAIKWVEHLVEAAKKSVEGKNLPTRWGGPADSLILLGRTGSGKTHIAYSVYQALLERNIAGRVLWANAADLYAALRPARGSNAEEIMRKHQQASVLFLDDLGAAKDSEWVEEVNYRLINWRYEYRLPTAVTANIAPQELPAKLGDRVASRLKDMGEFVIIRSEDRRGR